MPFVRWTARDPANRLKSLANDTGVDGRDRQSMHFDVAKLIHMLRENNTQPN